MDSSAVLPEGTRLGPYTLVRPLGRGATATVYEARRVERPFAVKVRARGEADLDRRFLREFEALRGLALPGVVRVYDAGVGERWLWYAMELVDGDPIREWIGAGETPAARVERMLHVGPALLDALAGIHRAGLIHRDLKPGNVLVDAHGTPTILDFGVVRWWNHDGDTLTTQGGLVGTLPFMAPEQVAGQPLTARADVFAVGLMLQEGVLGRRPKPPKTHDWLRIQCLERPRALAAGQPDVPLGVSAALARMVAFDPRDRPDAHDAATMLRACAAGSAPADWPEPGFMVAEPAEVRHALGAARGDGTPRIRVLEGPAGSGKRRLAEQVRRRAMLLGMRTFRGRCRIECPGGAVEEILDAALDAPADEAWRKRVAGPDAAQILELWPHLPLPVADDGTAQVVDATDAVVRACAAALGRCGSEAGLVLVFEGVEEADGLTSRIIDALARRMLPKTLILLTLDNREPPRRARRLVDGLVDAGLAERVPLADLSREDAAVLAATLVPEGGRAAEPSAGQRVRVDVEAGSPLRAVEAGVAALAAERGERFALLPASAHVAALVEHPLHPRVWSELGVDVPTFAARGDLRSVGARWAFRTSLQRAASLARLPNRAVAARRLAEALAHDPDGAHAARARALLLADDAAAAFPHAAQAALKAERIGRYRDARSYLLLVDTLPRDRASPEYQALRFPLAWCRAAVAAHTGSERPRADLVRLAADRARTDEERDRVALLEADLSRRAGEPRAAVVRLLQHANRAAQDPAGVPRAVELLVAAADVRVETGQPDDAAVLLDRADELRGARFQDVLQVRQDRTRCDAALARGRVDEALSVARQGLRAAETLGYSLGAAHLHRRIGQACFFAGDRALAESHGAAARRILVTAGERAAAAETALHLGVLALGRGDSATAHLLAEEALATARRLGRTRLRRGALALLLEVATARADEELAQRCLDEHAGLPSGVTGRAAAFAVAAVRWHRSHGDASAARIAARTPTGNGYRACELDIELARFCVERGTPAEAAEPLARASRAASMGGFRELVLYAGVVRARVEPTSDENWARVSTAALQTRWVELVLFTLVTDVLRRRARGDAAGATGRLAELQARAEEHRQRHFLAMARALA